MSEQTILQKSKRAFSDFLFNTIIKSQMGSEDVIFASFPRSGSNWLRYIITEIICIQNKIPIQTPLTPENHHDIAVIHSEKKMRFGGFVFHRYPRSKNLQFKIVKSHSQYRSSYKRVLYIHRNVADTLVSYFHYEFRKMKIEEKKRFDIDEFCLQKCDEFARHLKGFFEAFGDKYHGIITSYEKMKIEPISTIKLVCDFLKIDAEEEIIIRCINDHNLSNYGEQHQKGWNVPFVRSGKIGGSSHELNGNTIEELNKRCNQLYESLILDERGYYQDMSNF